VANCHRAAAARALLTGFCVVLARTIVSCATSVSSPPYTSHANTDGVEVPYAPPPARAEAVPEVSEAGAVWVDGEWVLSGTRWRWTRGRWVVPDAGTQFAPWRVVRSRDGRLFLFPGIWKDRDGNTVASPRAILEGGSRKVRVVDVDGEEERTGRDVRAVTRDGGP
jgi:hypothetical protein